MNNLDKLLDYGLYIFAAIGTLIITLLGGWDKLIYALVILVVIDYLTGLSSAFIKKSLSSDTGRKGIVKKVQMFFVVAVAVIADQIFNSGPVLRTATILFYVGNECLSILENVGVCGIPIPQQLSDAIVKLKGKG